MRFYNKALDYGKVSHPDVVELSTPPIEMNNILKSVSGDSQMSQVKRQIAEIEYDSRMKVIAEYYHSIDSGSERDQAIINEIKNFADVIEVLRYLEDDSAEQALDVAQGLSRGIDESVVSITTPLVRINTIFAETVNTGALSDDKKYLVAQVVDETRGLIGEMEDDPQYVDDLIYGLKESINEILYMNEDEASDFAKEGDIGLFEEDSTGELGELIDLSTIRDKE